MGNNGSLFGGKAAGAGHLSSSSAEIKNESGAVPPLSPFAFMTCTEIWLLPLLFLLTPCNFRAVGPASGFHFRISMSFSDLN